MTFEEGTQANWLHDVVRPLVTEVTVCDPRHNKLMQSGNKSDRVDAQKLAELLRLGSLKGVYHGDNGVRTLKELVRTYDGIVNLKRISRILPLHVGDCAFPSATNGGHFRRSSLKLTMPATCLTEWAPVKISATDVLKKLTAINIIASCGPCTATKGRVVIDNIVFH